MTNIAEDVLDANEQRVLEWINRGVNIELKYGVRNRTPLHLAVSVQDPTMHENYLSIVELLLFHGAKIDTKDMNGTTLLHTAFLGKADTSLSPVQRSRSPDLKMVELLIKNRADIDAKNHQGQTALHVAIITGNGTAATSIMQYGADVESRDSHGLTPLHYVSRVVASHRFLACSIAIGKELIRRGANVNAKTNDERTVRDLAQDLTVNYPSLRLGNSWLALLDTVITLQATRIAKRHMAFCMAQQHRLGNESHVSKLSAELQAMICRFTSDKEHKL